MKQVFKSGIKSEFIFQLVLHLLVLVFYSVDRRNPQFEFREFIFFLNYTCFTLIISYYFLPKYFYAKKYLTFFAAVSFILFVVILLEEFILEPIFYPGIRANSFPGVFLTLVGILPVMIILLGFKFAWDAVKKQHEVDELKTAVRESEIEFLKSQINPHFLFNNLNNLYAYAMENSPKTPAIILELSSVLRYMLYECKEAYVPLSKEIKQLEDFTRLYELQIEERGAVNFNASGQTNGYQIAPLILIVFIENAFKHSQANQSVDIEIDIRVDLKENGELHFYCGNNYQPISNTENLSISNGIGLVNVRKRLELIYPGSHQLVIDEKADYYEVNLQLQLTK